MTDEWTFRTTTGTATVADGRLEISGSARRLARGKWRDGWTTNAAGRRALFVFSTVSTAWFVVRGARKVPAVLAGRADLPSLFLVACIGLIALVVAYRATRTKTARLRDVAAARRVDDDRLSVEFDDEARDPLEIETPTERDADEAAEILRLRGVPVEDATDADTSESVGFRRRLLAKEK
ncbi:hypothetical protein M0R89_13075 [Halorussus limi]|uniref:Uncharacterized protein n=1 Tax=Halorussus limi TaxID=2938695 RepID=A0A8U0HQW6_9EURY|nr:hypothetical protein [Halorussus limi]UPV73472.1 hypothetical protein M0R89_13075 [Halorussus limi]